MDEQRIALDSLITALDDRSALIGIVGMGYVGLPLALAYARAGYRVLGIDADVEKVDRLNRGESYIEHIPSERIGRMLDIGFRATTDPQRAREADALVLCVPTPLNKYREPDLSYVTSTVDSLTPHLRPGQVVSLESTTYPGTTDEELRPRIEAGGLRVGRDVFLVYSPEREDPGNSEFATHSIPKVIGGHTPACLEAGLALYRHAIDHLVPVSSTRAAEMTKLLENIHRAVNIGLANEMKVVAERMGIDIYEVIDAAATKPFGFTAYYPGPGIGGHCIPVDPFYLTWKAREYGLHTRFIELAGEINRSMPEYVVTKLAEALNERGKPLKGSRVLVVGIAYKKNVDDMRESPAVEIMELLRVRGATLSYTDPHVPRFPPMREHRFDLCSVDPTPETIAAHDAVVIATDHDAIDYVLIADHARLLVDTRGRYRATMSTLVRA